ncbi:serine/threonine-protein kinase MARK2-like [Talpa occidentalis]|uniref:serine/threonine-protein kinase MARK2-like n=1 Tax=Talpa occidentalis TaxID=50954 RepID=UPI00188EDDCC|nr:serine/threonine-protein kinase MARK2-like [Talpa occidentalis]
MLKRLTLQGRQVKTHLVLGTLGEGAHAQVRLALHALTSTKVAIKTLREAKLRDLRLLAGEVGCLKALHHPCMVELFQVVGTREELQLVMEYVEGGDLLDYLNEWGRLTENEARQIFRQIISALSYCHAKGIAHWDVKPKNIVLVGEKHIKLADIGLSVRCFNHTLSTYCSRAEYRALELSLHQRYISPGWTRGAWASSSSRWSPARCPSGGPASGRSGSASWAGSCTCPSTFRCSAAPPAQQNAGTGLPETQHPRKSQAAPLGGNE